MDGSMNQPSLSPVTVAPGQGRVIHAFGAEFTLLLGGEQTGNEFMLASVITPPGGGPPPHYHLREDECFILQEGRVLLLTEGVWREIGPGTVIFLPRNSVHTYKNIGETPCRMLEYVSPAGFERFFARCAEEFGRAGGPDKARIVEISAEFGIYYETPAEGSRA
jgi:quercetin dioxygenase-like cupin family protein